MDHRSVTPPDLETWKRVYDQIKQHTVEGVLGVELISVDAETLVLEVEITDRVRQPYGLLHGGVSLLLAEGAASMHASYGVDLSKVSPVGLEVSGSHLRSVRDGRVQARATVIRRGRHAIVHEVRIVHVESERLLCLARVTNMYRSTKADGALGVAVKREAAG
jgi:1,4-dihydroxy-2-naphthoyl-CoA hydrolase